MLLAALLVLTVVLFSVQDGSQNTVSFSNSFTGDVVSASTPSKGPDFGDGEMTIQTKVVVQVVGRVKNPGVYELPADSRVLDAVFQAGGFESDADQASLNLARPLNDGEQLVVLSKSETSMAGSETSDGLAHGQSRLISLNLADTNLLDSLPGIGPSLAQRIVDYRAANGGFRSVSDLDKVAGIGPSLMARLKDLVSL